MAKKLGVKAVKKSAKPAKVQSKGKVSKKVERRPVTRDDSDDDDLELDEDSEQELGDMPPEQLDDGDYGTISQHKEELEKLRKSDPEFFKYLQENDDGLLNFGEDESEDEMNSEIQHAENDMEFDEDEDEAADEVDFDESRAQQKKKKRNIVAQEVSSELLESAVKGALEGSIGDLKKLVSMFRAASQPLLSDEDAVGDEEQKSGVKFTISSPDVYQLVMTRAIETIHKAIAVQLELRTPFSKSKLQSLSSHKRWKKLQMIVLVVFKLVLQNLNAVGLHAKHHQVTVFLLNSLEHYIPFLAPLPRLTKTTLKVLLNLFAGPMNDGMEQKSYQHVRGNSFLRLRQMALQLPGSVTEECFRLVYLKFARRCKSFNESNMATVLYLSNCIAELYKLDVAVAYQQSFLFIRQLALHLRAAFLKKGEAMMKNIRCWQFVNCLRVWTKVLSAMPTDLEMLCFPLSQIMLGVMNLLPSTYYSPLRFQLVSCLQYLAAHCQLFIPTAHHLCEILECAELFGKPSPSTDVPPVIQYLLAFPPNSISKPQTRDVLVNEVIHLLRMEIEIYKFNAGFPEYSFLVSRKLRAFSKKSKQNKWRDLARTVNSQIHQMSTFVKNERVRQGVSPATAQGFEALIPKGVPPAAERLQSLLANRSKFLLAERPVKSSATRSPQSEDDDSVEDDDDSVDESPVDDESDVNESDVSGSEVSAEADMDHGDDRVKAFDWDD